MVDGLEDGVLVGGAVVHELGGAVDDQLGSDDAGDCQK